MSITLFSFLSSVLWSSVLIIGIFCFRKFRHFQTSFGLWTLVFLYLFCIIRAILPLELPYVVELGIENVYPQIYRFLTTSYSLGANLHFSVLTVLCLIWIAVSIILFIRYLYIYRKASRRIMQYAAQCGEREYEMLDAVKQTTGQSVNIKLYSVPNISIPFGIGIFSKAILLPQHEYLDKELYFILLHEYTHFLNRDTLMKVMVSGLRCIFWWNPVVYLLSKDLEQTLEMKCDIAATKGISRKEKVEYLRTIVNVMKQCTETKAIPYVSTALFKSESGLDIKERFEMVIHADTKQSNTGFSLVMLFICASIFVISYIFIPQPAFNPPASTNPNVIDFDSSDTYIVHTKDGIYWLCIPGQEPKELSKEQLSFYKQIGFCIETEK